MVLFGCLVTVAANASVEFEVGLMKTFAIQSATDKKLRKNVGNDNCFAMDSGDFTK